MKRVIVSVKSTQRDADGEDTVVELVSSGKYYETVSYTHLRAHETSAHLVCRLLLEKKKNILNVVI